MGDTAAATTGHSRPCTKYRVTMAKRTRNPAPKKRKNWKPVFLRELAKTACVLYSAVKAGVARMTVYDARVADEAFKEAWDAAVELANDLLLVEGRRRAYEGVLRPIYQGGKLRGKVKDYSDTLLIFFIKARNPEFRENGKVIIQGGGQDAPPVMLDLRKPDPAAFRDFLNDVSAVIVGESVADSVAESVSGNGPASAG